MNGAASSVLRKPDERLLTDNLPCVEYRTFAARRTLEAGGTNLCRIDGQLGNGAAERVAVHAQLLGSFALISPVMRQHFDKKAPFELPHRLVVGNAAGVHLRHKVFQFTLHSCLFLSSAFAARRRRERVHLAV